MDAVQKAVSGAVQAVKNSPLLKRRFGGRQQSNNSEETDHEFTRSVSPLKDPSPFIQGFTYRVEYLGKSVVEPGQEQNHGCTDKAVQLLWIDSGQFGKLVSVKVTTNIIRVKLVEEKTILYEFPVLRVSYCGLDKRYKEAVSFVARENENLFCCYVFKTANHEKAYALALSISKAFYLACQIGQEQQGLFPPTPERDLLFEPQREDDTKISPARPNIPGSPMSYRLHTQQNRETVDGATPTVQVTRPSVTSMSSSLASSMDEDFFRLARSRSNPDILRSTIEHRDIVHPSLELVQQHADPISTGTTPVATPTGSTENLLTH